MHHSSSNRPLLSVLLFAVIVLVWTATADGQTSRLANGAQDAKQATSGDQSTDTSTAEQDQADQAEEEGPIEWEDIDEAERATMLRMLESQDWPFRVFGLLRLERYTGRPIIQLLGNRLHDDAWQVRCFAIRQATRMDIPITASDLSGESDPRVLRAALWNGVDIPIDTLRPIAEQLMKRNSIDAVLVGMELAAASGDPKLQSQAADLVRRIIRNMTDAIAAYTGRRLARMLGLSRPMVGTQQWRSWLNSVRGRIEFAHSPGLQSTSPTDGTELFSKPPIFAEMDTSTFARLIDYLSGLAQSQMDLVIVMDITASMAPMLDEARAGVDALLQFFSDITRSLRLGFVAYRDHDNPPVWQGQPFTTETQRIRDFLFNLTTAGGADYPEAVYDGLAASAEMRWDRESVRQIILVGDAPPHDRDLENLGRLLRDFRDADVTLHVVHVPMKLPQDMQRMMPPEQLRSQKDFFARYNSDTARTFDDMVKVGDGRLTTLTDAGELVPAVMHFAIERHWWPVFDEFYKLYVDLCR